MAEDYTLLIILIGAISAIIAVVTFVATQLWNRRNRKDKLEDTRRAYEIETEDKAQKKGIAERTTAKGLEDEREAEALEVKEEGREHIRGLLETLKQDIKYQHSEIYTVIDKGDVKGAQTDKDLMEFKRSQNKINETTVKAIEFIHSFLFGPKAHSLADYVEGQKDAVGEQTKADIGVFDDANIAEEDKGNPI
jgi:hypothetical protein